MWILTYLEKGVTANQHSLEQLDEEHCEKLLIRIERLDSGVLERARKLQFDVEACMSGRGRAITG